jgi:hypothetical protein
MSQNSSFLKCGLVVFWALWLSVVFVTNVLDFLKVLGWLEQHWRFASGNFDFIVATTARYDVPRTLDVMLFAGVIAWEATAAALFWRAAWARCRRPASAAPAVHTAFIVSLGLWCAFMLADEVCISYGVEATHMRIFIAQLASLLTIDLLREETSPTDAAR